eukprot:1161877-Pelagomonas_calceolata.AAC.2
MTWTSGKISKAATQADCCTRSSWRCLVSRYDMPDAKETPLHHRLVAGATFCRTSGDCEVRGNRTGGH